MKSGGTTVQRGDVHCQEKQNRLVQFQTSLHCSLLDHSSLKNSKTTDKLICFNHSSFSAPNYFSLIPFIICQITSTDRSNKRHPDRTRRGKIDLDATLVTDVQNYRFGSIVVVVVVVCWICSFFMLICSMWTGFLFLLGMWLVSLLLTV